MLEHAKDYYVEWPQSLKLGTRFRVGWAMPIWNRPLELQRSLQGISRSDMRGSVLVLVDDASDNVYTKNLLSEFNLSDIPVIKMRRISPVLSRPNMQTSLCIAWDMLHSYLKCDYFGVLDSDTLVRKRWTQNMCQIADMLGKQHSCFVLSGFNTHRHRSISVHKNYVVKSTLGGISMLFPSHHYVETVRPVLNYYLWDSRLCIVCAYKNAPMIATRPSVVQHIGRVGTWSKGILQFDVAWDYHVPFLSRYLIFYAVVQLVNAVLIKVQIWIKRQDD